VAVRPQRHVVETTSCAAERPSGTATVTRIEPMRLRGRRETMTAPISANQPNARNRPRLTASGPVGYALMFDSLQTATPAPAR
jgi:hypothetical protein